MCISNDNIAAFHICIFLTYLCLPFPSEFLVLLSLTGRILLRGIFASRVFPPFEKLAHRHLSPFFPNSTREVDELNSDDNTVVT